MGNGGIFNGPSALGALGLGGIYTCANTCEDQCQDQTGSGIDPTCLAECKKVFASKCKPGSTTIIDTTPNAGNAAFDECSKKGLQPGTSEFDQCWSAWFKTPAGVSATNALDAARKKCGAKAQPLSNEYAQCLAKEAPPQTKKTAAAVPSKYTPSNLSYGAPTQDKGMPIVLILAGVAALGGLYYYSQQKKKGAMKANRRRGRR